MKSEKLRITHYHLPYTIYYLPKSPTTDYPLPTTHYQPDFVLHKERKGFAAFVLTFVFFVVIIRGLLKPKQMVSSYKKKNKKTNRDSFLQTLLTFVETKGDYLH